jgi:glycosyltransferase involved in cell wall biosynthesis
MKGYPVLAKAAKRILEKYPNVSFYSIGYGQDSIMNDAKQYLGDYSNRFIWFGKNSTPETIMSGWDIYCSSSLYGEGFSNSIIEAMSCSLPIIATDVGDAPYQVEGVGLIIKPGDDEALFNSLDEWISKGTFKEVGIIARKRVLDYFSSKLMAKRTEDYLLKIVKDVK